MLKVKMLDTVEDSHPFLSTDPETKKPVISYDVQKFVIDSEQAMPKDRAEKLIALGYAEAI